MIAKRYDDELMYSVMKCEGDKKEWYLDAYKKFENRCIPMSADDEVGL